MLDVCACMHACMNVCMFVCMHVCMYIYIAICVSMKYICIYIVAGKDSTWYQVQYRGANVCCAALTAGDR